MSCFCGHVEDEHDDIGVCDVLGCSCDYFDEEGIDE